VLSPFDDFPIHPSADPIAHPATGDINHSIFASGAMPTDRSTTIGPIRIDVVDPMCSIRYVVEPNEHGITCESVAPPGGVMLSASTARLVETNAMLGEPEMVRIKGAAEPVGARQLLAVETRHGLVGAESTLVGRGWEVGPSPGYWTTELE
jgi:hypothetical protein